MRWPLLLLLPLSLFGCKDPIEVRSAAVNTFSQEGNTWLHHKYKMAGVSMEDSNEEFPLTIHHGKNTVGRLKMTVKEKVLSVDLLVQLDPLLKLTTSYRQLKLPNGQPWPVTGWSHQSPLTLKAGPHDVHFDLDGRTERALVAVFLSEPRLLRIGADYDGQSFLRRDSMPKGWSGLVGFYFSKDPMKNGLAWMADLHKIYESPMVRRRLAGTDGSHTETWSVGGGVAAGNNLLRVEFLESRIESKNSFEDLF